MNKNRGVQENNILSTNLIISSIFCLFLTVMKNNGKLINLDKIAKIKKVIVLIVQNRTYKRLHLIVRKKAPIKN